MFLGRLLIGPLNRVTFGGQEGSTSVGCVVLENSSRFQLNMLRAGWPPLSLYRGILTSFSSRTEVCYFVLANEGSKGGGSLSPFRTYSLK